MRNLVLLGLVGCGCPDFAAIEVDTTAVEAEDPETVVAHVEHALADFALWSERAGVCVDRVEVRDEIEAPTPSGPTPVLGNYRAMAQSITADSDPAWLEETVRHELCHALDRMEDLSTGREALFPPESVEDLDLYGTEAERLREAFAQACEEIPDDQTVAEAASEACGEDLVSERTRFRHEVVFPGFPTGVPVAAGAPLAPLAWRTVYTLPSRRSIRDVSGDAHGLVVLTFGAGTRTGRDQVVRLVDVDLDTGAARPRWDLPVGDRERMPSVGLVPSDTEDTYVLDAGTGLYRVDRGGVATLWAWPAGVTSGRAAVSGGVVYATAASKEGYELRAWNLATRVELPVTGTGLESVDGLPSDRVVPSALWPSEGGVEAMIADTFARFEGGAWTTWPTAAHAHDRRVRAEETRDFLIYSPFASAHPATLDLATGAWTVRPVCDRSVTLNTPMVAAAGRTWVYDASSADRVLAVAELELD